MTGAKRLGLWIAGATLVVAIIGLLITANSSNSGDQVSVRGDGNAAGAQGNGAAGNVQGNNPCVAIGAGAVATCPGHNPIPLDPDTSDKKAEQKIFRDARPVAPGPWAFSVLYDKGIGVFVRNEPVKEGGYRIGFVPTGTVVWVDCVTRSSFDPEPGLMHGALWYRLRWPNNARSEKAFASEPNDPPQGYAWSFYLRPNGHNGDVPDCQR